MKNSGEQVKAITLLAVLVAVSTGAVRADDIESRLSKQQGRIGKAQGNKKLSGSQVTRADNFDYKITAEEQEMKTKNHGKLTRRDKAKLNRQINRNTRTINRELKK